MTTSNLIQSPSRRNALGALAAISLAGCATQSVSTAEPEKLVADAQTHAQQFHPRPCPDMDPGQPRSGKGAADRAAGRQGGLHLRWIGGTWRSRGARWPRLGGAGVLQSGDGQRGFPGGYRRVGSHHRRDDRPGIQFAVVDLRQGWRRCERCRGSGGRRSGVHGHGGPGSRARGACSEARISMARW